jgi:hypothetical protein
MPDTDYIFFGGAGVPAAPYVCRGSHCFAFICLGREDAIQDFIDRTLNAAIGTAGRYRNASGPIVYLAILSADAVGSATPPFSAWGTMAETDIGFWLLVSDTAIPGSVYWYPAYLFVDTWMALVGGREVWGFPKALATITAPNGLTDGPVSVSTLAIREFAPDARAETAEIFRVTPGRFTLRGVVDSLAMLRMTVLTMVDHLPREIISCVTIVTETFDAAIEAMPVSGPMIFVKQFRDISDTEGTCFKGVVTADATLIGLPHDTRISLSEYRLSLADFASQPIARDLGLAIGDQPLWMILATEVDFVMELGKVVRPES